MAPWVRWPTSSPPRSWPSCPIPCPCAMTARLSSLTAPTIITVTRLVEQKGLDVLLRACAEVFRVLPSWRLAVVGDGPLREELECLADQLGIADRIEWMGHVKDPAPYLRAAEFFVLTSRFEGSPNALLEAMAVGLPAVVSDASPGPIELIGGAAAGLVVPVGDVACDLSGHLETCTGCGPARAARRSRQGHDERASAR